MKVAMETSERIVSGNGQARVRFNRTLPRRFRAHESYISLAVRRVSLKKGRVNLSKYGPYLFGLLGQTNFDAETRQRALNFGKNDLLGFILKRTQGVGRQERCAVLVGQLDRKSVV